MAKSGRARIATSQASGWPSSAVISRRRMVRPKCSWNPFPHTLVPACFEGLTWRLSRRRSGPLDTKKAIAWMRARGLPAADISRVSTRRTAILPAATTCALNDLHAAFADPEVDAIICLRGGYGTPRLLDRIDFQLLRHNAKPFIGYSDITALHLAISRYAGFVTFHGPCSMPIWLGEQTADRVLILQHAQGPVEGRHGACPSGGLSVDHDRAGRRPWAPCWAAIWR